MLTSITFKNFRVLRDATLPLGPFTLLVGPNGSGKSTALLALERWRERYTHFYFHNYTYVSK
jgi:AAA15 family ATPase/GTPase